jgi:hypothetical protein
MLKPQVTNGTENFKASPNRLVTLATTPHMLAQSPPVTHLLYVGIDVCLDIGWSVLYQIRTDVM